MLRCGIRRGDAVAMSLVAVIALGGCAHVPRESAQLSQELTGMIKAAQTAHMSLIEGYVGERRARVDAFMKNNWIPDFLGGFVNESDVLGRLEKAGSASEKGKVMLQFAEAATEKIYERRSSQMAALDAIERTMKDEVGAHYADMLTVNQAITAHLMSAAKVNEARNELLKQLKIDGKDAFPVDRINEILDRIVRCEGKLEELPKYVEEVKVLIGREK